LTVQVDKPSIEAHKYADEHRLYMAQKSMACAPASQDLDPSVANCFCNQYAKHKRVKRPEKLIHTSLKYIKNI
jgi:hypothetical protein